METLDDVTLGSEYRDTVSGFKGIATSRHEYLNGCVRVVLEKLHDSHELKELTFDIQRLELVAVEKQEHAVRRTGGARSAPRRTGA